MYVVDMRRIETMHRSTEVCMTGRLKCGVAIYRISLCIGVDNYNKECSFNLARPIIAIAFFARIEARYLVYSHHATTI